MADGTLYNNKPSTETTRRTNGAQEGEAWYVLMIKVPCLTSYPEALLSSLIQLFGVQLLIINDKLAY
jgi:hypothetical protein